MYATNGSNLDWGNVYDHDLNLDYVNVCDQWIWSGLRKSRASHPWNQVVAYKSQNLKLVSNWWVFCCSLAFLKCMVFICPYFIWILNLGFWKFVTWNFETWNLEFGIWNLQFEIWKLKIWIFFFKKKSSIENVEFLNLGMKIWDLEFETKLENLNLKFYP